MPVASLTVQVLLTTIGHSPVSSTSIYDTSVIPQYVSVAAPWFIVSENSVYEEFALVVEYTGPVMSSVPQPSIFLTTGQVVISGGVRSFTFVLIVISLLSIFPSVQVSEYAVARFSIPVLIILQAIPSTTT